MLAVPLTASNGAFVLGAVVLPLVWNAFRSYRYGRVITVACLWGLAGLRRAWDWITGRH